MLWILWDFFPLCSMIVIHYRNFRTFAEDSAEILYTEYTADDLRGSSTKGHDMLFNSSDKLKLSSNSNALMTTSGVMESGGGNVYDTSIIDSSVY